MEWEWRKVAGNRYMLQKDKSNGDGKEGLRGGQNRNKVLDRVEM
jgi:hypothetical protein